MASAPHLCRINRKPPWAGGSGAEQNRAVRAIQTRSTLSVAVDSRKTGPQDALEARLAAKNFLRINCEKRLQHWWKTDCTQRSVQRLRPEPAGSWETGRKGKRFNEARAQVKGLQVTPVADRLAGLGNSRPNIRARYCRALAPEVPSPSFPVLAIATCCSPNLAARKERRNQGYRRRYPRSPRTRLTASMVDDRIFSR